MFSSDYCKGISAAYWAEEDEMRMGIHPSQIIPRIELEIKQYGVHLDEITFYDWSISGPRVIVKVNHEVFGVYNYDDDEFESTPDDRLEEATKNFEVNCAN